MPFYDYLCESNGKMIEIHHRMNELIETWGELCKRSGQPLGDTPAEAPVRKLIGTGNAQNAPGTLAKAERPLDRDSATPMRMRDNKF